MLLTTSIGEIAGQVVSVIVPRDSSLHRQVREEETRCVGQLGGLAEREDSLRVEDERELGAQAGFNLPFRQPKSLSDGIGDRQGDAHGFTLARGDKEEKMLWCYPI